MAPATIAGAAPKSRPDRAAKWTREEIISAIQEWAALYGEPPRAADWNPSSAKWSGQMYRVDRYRAGRPNGAGPWPALNSAKRPFSGSLSAAIVAAGFTPAKPGPKRRSDVDPEQAHRTVMSPDARVMLAAALARARDAERRVACLEVDVERARERSRCLAAERDAAKRRVPPRPPAPKAGRARGVDAAAAAGAQRRVDAAQAKARAAEERAGAQISEARMDAAEARATTKRLAVRLERAEATIGTLRDERRDLRREIAEARLELARMGDHAVALQRTVDAVALEAAHAPAVVTVLEASPDAAELRAAAAAVTAARRGAAVAELRAARAERELRETVAAVRGEPRKLTAAELEQLRAAGPAGPALMALALKSLASARRTSNPTALHSALQQIAEAAVTWRERI